jgi:hypothetical protein
MDAWRNAAGSVDAYVDSSGISVPDAAVDVPLTVPAGTQVSGGSLQPYGGTLSGWVSNAVTADPPTPSGGYVPAGSTTAPTAPTGVTAAAGDASATVTWTEPSNAATSNITGYRIRRYDGDTTTLQATTTVGASARSFTATGLTNGQSYSFDVTAISGTSTLGEVSTRSAAVTPQATVPTAPSGVTASAGSGSATVTWGAPSNASTSNITGYRIRRYDGDTTTLQATTTVGASARSFTATGLTNGQSYSFDVTAISGTSTLGEVSTRSAAVTPANVPAAPVIGTADPGVAGDAITATARWSEPPSDGGSAITAYRVRALRISSTGSVIDTTVSGLRPATERLFEMTLPVTGNYRFTVQAFNAIGSGAISTRSNLVAGR